MAPPRRLQDDFFDPRAKSRALGLLWIAGATVGVITLALPHDPDINEAGNLGLAAFVFLVAVTVLVPGRLSRDWQVHAAVALSSLILTAGVYFTETTQIYLVMYTWPALFAFYYFSLRLALAHMAFIGVVFGALLLGEDPMTSPVTRWVLAVGTPIAAGLVVSSLIRRMREQARALARGEERHRLTIQSAHDAFVAIDRHSRIVDWNEAAERLLGWSRATVLGRFYPDLLLPPEERAGHIERRDAILADPEPVKTGRVIELPFLARDGRRIPAEVRVTMVEVDGERYLSTFIRDLTERRRREEEQARRLDVERSLERERRIAETLQRSLLPERLPVLPGLAVAGRYLPAAAEAEVGGDWYDVVRTPDGKVGLVMGDIAGKGLAAAAMVGRLRSALRAYVLEGHPPAAAIERLNHLIFTEQDDRPMSTLLVVLFDPTRDTLLWASAGHLPPIVIGPERAEFLGGASGVPLGVIPHASFTETSDRLERSETLLLYTDGLVERPGEIIDAGLKRLLDAAREPQIEADALCDRLLEALVPSGGARDDVAVLALENPAPAPSFEIVVPPEPESLVWIRQHLRRWLTDAGADERELFEVILACDEACTNAVEHAHSQHGDVSVSGSLRGTVVEVTIGDAGRWRPAKAESDQGRGLTMMRELMDGVEVATGGEGSVVTLRRALRSLGAVEPVA